ncbi:hypothetical protein GE09DRAFT_588199 [Coniochaeta sp. 2T2.1]|nr:hypothetical protein GE09DRAFT_588199 [Coniochaeta sp. 2T2.1]
MKRRSLKKRSNLEQSTSSRGRLESKTIAILPSTTLNYPGDILESAETVFKYSTSYGSQAPSPPSWQKTLRPSKPSRDVSMVADDDDDEEYADEDEDDRPTLGWCSTSKVGGGSSPGGLGCRHCPAAPAHSGRPCIVRRRHNHAIPGGRRRTKVGQRRRLRPRH